SDVSITGVKTKIDSYSAAVAKNVVVLTLGLTINYINGSLIYTFRKHQIFYMNPRYILFIHLVVNDMIQLTTTIILLVLSYTIYKINFSLCCVLIIFAVFTTINSPLNLAVMAVECYIAICLPLQHAELCTIKRTYILISFIWAVSAMTTLSDVFFMIVTEPIKLFFSTVVCIPEEIFRNPIIAKKKNVLYIIYLVGVWLTLLYSYFQIFFAAKAVKSANADAKKARNTIVLHGFQLLLCMLTYVFPNVLQFLLNLFPKNYLHVYFVCYIIIQVLPRFVSPIVYGIRDTTFRQHLRKHQLCITKQTR
uniref:Odorant receptor 131-2-like n=1 Tax=Sphaeramia orbicularis TaxID=375764 RepID=A0A672ZFM9_9TELE